MKTKILVILLAIFLCSCESFMLSPLVITGVETNNKTNNSVYSGYRYIVHLEGGLNYFTNKKYYIGDTIR